MTQAPTPGPLSGKRYRKKPVVIEAIQWTGDNLRSVITFTDGPPDTRSHHASMKWEDYADLVARDGLRIFTREDGPDAQVKHYASVGDFIIRGVQGELYACKPDIFAATYEPESLAPTAPVEASGSDDEDPIDVQEIEGRHDVDPDEDVEDIEWPESALGNDLYRHVQSQFCLHDDEAAEEAGEILSILAKHGVDPSKLPNALRLQRSGETREDRLSAALIAMVEHFERVDAAPEDKAAIQAACDVWASVKRDKALSTTPARAEAQDEGVAK